MIWVSPVIASQESHAPDVQVALQLRQHLPADEQRQGERRAAEKDSVIPLRHGQLLS
jgi:hypothetical protein